MVLRPVAVTADPHHVATLGGRQLLTLVGELGHQLGRVQARLDTLGELDLFLGVEQRHLADLLEVGAHGIGRGGQLRVLARLAQRLGFLFVPDEVTGGLVLLGGLSDLVVVGGLVGLRGLGRGFLRGLGDTLGGVVVTVVGVVAVVGVVRIVGVLVDLDVLEVEVLVDLELLAGFGVQIVVGFDLRAGQVVDVRGFLAPACGRVTLCRGFLCGGALGCLLRRCRPVRRLGGGCLLGGGLGGGALHRLVGGRARLCRCHVQPFGREVLGARKGATEECRLCRCRRRSQLGMLCRSRGGRPPTTIVTTVCALAAPSGKFDVSACRKRGVTVR